MKLDIPRSLTNARRHLNSQGFIVRDYCTKNLVYTMANAVNPRTPDQTAARDSMRRAGEVWKALPPEAREKYDEYARLHAGAIGAELYKRLNGWDVFLPAFRNRELLGHGPADAPLAQPPPPTPLAIEEMPSDDPRAFSFRVTHTSPVAGHMVLVRITPPMRTAACTPLARRTRMICGYGAQSLASLPESGGVAAFANAQFAIPPATRHGVEARIVRAADGVHGRPLFADVIRAG